MIGMPSDSKVKAIALRVRAKEEVRFGTIDKRSDLAYRLIESAVESIGRGEGLQRGWS